MSDKASKHLLSYMEEVKRATENMIRCLLENPSCLDGNPKKEEAYQMALEYFKSKQEKSKSTNPSYAKAYAIQLRNLIDSYYQAEEGNKNDYAVQLAIKLLNTVKFWLRLIPDQLKDEAFQIIFKYLEEQMHS